MTARVVLPDRIIALSNAFKGAKVLLSAVEIGVFTALSGAALCAEDLARRVGVHPRGARDFFDALVALGLLDRDATGRYGNTAETATYLDEARPTYIGGELEHVNGRVYAHWNHLTPALRSGQPQSGTRGTGGFPAMYGDRAALTQFARGMTAGALLPAAALARAFDWRHRRRLLDVGTAEGCIAARIAQAHPHLTSIGFDLPPLKPLFEAYVERAGVADRLKFHPGDFFVDPFPATDAVVFGRILHNWDLAGKMALLKKAWEALPPGGAVIVCERLIDDERRSGTAGLLSSLNMLIMSAGGFDFSGRDCTDWMRQAGFRDITTVPLAAEQSAVIGLK